MTIKAWPDLRIRKGEVAENLKIFWARWENSFGDHSFGFLFSSRSKLQNVNIILLSAFPDATDAFSDASIVYYSSKDICAINAFEKLLNILFSEVYC